MKCCFSCFRACDNDSLNCPYCGQELSTKPLEPIHLIPGTVLHNRYVIGYAVGSGGFGIVYKAWDSKLETIIAIKEFFLSRIVNRAEGSSYVIVNRKNSEEFGYRKARFLAEARNMAKFGSHKTIPNVFEFFEENNTAYIVMEYLNGITLGNYLSQISGKIDVDFAILIANEVCTALKSLHSEKIIHQDVAPDNIYICKGKNIRIKLMDLGAAKLQDATDDVIDIVMKPGYSPQEQYENTNDIGPWTDIYSLGATMYIMLTGIKPDESTNRKIQDTVIPVKELNPEVSENLSNTVMKAMAVEKHMRFKTVDELLMALNGQKKVVALEKEKKIRKRKRLSGVIAAIVAIAIGIGIVYQQYNNKNELGRVAGEYKIWFPVENEEIVNDSNLWPNNMGNLQEIFKKNYKNAEITFVPIIKDKYIEELESNAGTTNFPDIFESTDVSEEFINSFAIDLDTVIENSKRFSEFSEDYWNYYSNSKKMPFSIKLNSDTDGIIENDDGTICCSFTFEWSVTSSKHSEESQIILKHMLDDDLKDICFDMIPVYQSAFNDDNYTLFEYKDRYDDFIFQ